MGLNPQPMTSFPLLYKCPLPPLHHVQLNKLLSTLHSQSPSYREIPQQLMEYSINVEKLQTIKRDNMSKNTFSTLVHYSLLALMLVLSLSSLLWIPTLCSSLKLFLLDTLPKTIAVVSSPKCLFVIFNIIIIFLVGESRLTGSSSSKLDIYEEYVIHNQRLKGLPSGEDKVKEKKEEVMEGNVLKSPLVEEKEEEEVKEEMVVESYLVEEKEEEEVKEEMVVESSLVEEKEEEEVKEEMVESVKEEEEEEVEVECEVLKEEEEKEEKEELNRRVEAFIAMVNMQMRLEARMVVSCG